MPTPNQQRYLDEIEDLKARGAHRAPAGSPLGMAYDRALSKAAYAGEVGGPTPPPGPAPRTPDPVPFTDGGGGDVSGLANDPAVRAARSLVEKLRTSSGQIAQKAPDAPFGDSTTETMAKAATEAERQTLDQLRAFEVIRRLAPAVEAIDRIESTMQKARGTKPKSATHDANVRIVEALTRKRAKSEPMVKSRAEAATQGVRDSIRSAVQQAAGRPVPPSSWLTATRKNGTR